MHMREQQLTSTRQASSPSASVSRAHLVTVECVDGSVVQLQAEGTDTVAEIRRVALGQVLGGGSAGIDSAYTILVGGTVTDPVTTVDQLLSQNLQLQLNLIKPGAWGQEPAYA